MKLISLILIVTSVASAVHVYYEPITYSNAYQPQVSYGEQETHGQSQKSDFIQHTYETQEHLGDHNVGPILHQNFQQQDYVSQRHASEIQPLKSENYIHIAGELNNQTTAQYNNYNDYANKQANIGAGGHVVQENIGYEAGHSELVKARTPKIIDYQFEGNDHAYKYKYRTENGIQAHEIGDKKAKQVEGSYAYVGDDGKTYTVTYVADEHGFRAQGAHLPTPPPMPAAIAEALEKNAKDEASGIIDDGEYHEVEKGQADPQGYHEDYQPVQYVTVEQNGYKY